jgi:DNA-binding NarL/FixJ family response regulator
MNPTPQSSLGEREGIEPRRQTETARVVVVDDNQLRASALAAALKGASDTIVVVSGPDSRAMQHDLFPADLVLLALGGRQVSALATGAEAVQRNPYAEVIFYCDDPDAPEVSAAAVLGITRIVPAQNMAAWLSRAGALLARGAYLRRAAAATIAVAPEPPTLATSALDAARLPLPTAEMRFRESYIRCLLTQSGSRQEAARRAGVPYRTMCEMIRKLGISTK